MIIWPRAGTPMPPRPLAGPRCLPTKSRLRRMLATPTRQRSRLPVLPPSPPVTPVATSSLTWTPRARYAWLTCPTRPRPIALPSPRAPSSCIPRRRPWCCRTAPKRATCLPARAWRASWPSNARATSSPCAIRCSLPRASATLRPSLRRGRRPRTCPRAGRRRARMGRLAFTYWLRPA